MKTALEDRGLVREVSITIMLTEKEKEKINQAAQKLGMTLSSYCRFELLKKFDQ